jgi:hypothetical protein
MTQNEKLYRLIVVAVVIALSIYAAVEIISENKPFVLE